MIRKNKVGKEGAPQTVIAGGAGFIGSVLAKELRGCGESVWVLDNYSNAQANYQKGAHAQDLPCDVSDRDDLCRALDIVEGKGPVGHVWHLAANSDIKSGTLDVEIDLRDTLCTTVRLADEAGSRGVEKFFFASSSAVYGQLEQGERAAEDRGSLLPISNYGAMKLASESALSAAAEKHGMDVACFRFPNVVGAPASHGVMFDFVHRLMKDPSCLHVLGDGRQRKLYMHVEDLVSALMHVASQENGRRLVLNVGPGDADEGIDVASIAKICVQRVSPGAKIAFGASDRGWVGDVPVVSFSTAKLSGLGWACQSTSVKAVERACQEISEQLSLQVEGL